MLLIKCISKGLLQYQKLSFSTTCITRYLNCARSLLKLRLVQASVGPLVSLQEEATSHTGEVAKVNQIIFVVCELCYAFRRPKVLQPLLQLMPQQSSISRNWRVSEQKQRRQSNCCKH